MKVTGCFCFDLETGGKILGWLGIIGGVILLIGSFNIEIETQNCSISDEQSSDFKVSCIEPNIKINPDVKPIGIVLLIGGLILYSLLLVGINNRNHNLLLPVIFAYIAGIVIDVILLITIIFVVGSFDSLIGYFLVPLFFVILIHSCLSIYFARVLYSLYEKIKSERELPSYYA
ncbi:unnamed protein product [Chironomus riparius]|uniref:Uncharacterized protein n=1 Tax=Chironomus riparius TaxID=315576 RepID=A0A9N9RJ22_9DIPT|nr:unnamed protein product [Chironomus riparius]